MSNLTKLIVSLNFGKEEIEVGELAKANDNIYFKYYQSFLKRRFEISPFKIPLADQIYTAPKEPFDGLFGVFNDSLPDGWGRLLLDRKLSSLGKSLSDISPLDRLAFVGSNGMGALTYQPKIESASDNELSLELDEIAREMSIILEGTDSEMLDELYQMGGSSGGARPKIFVGYNPDTDIITYNTATGPFEEYWIIKFPSSSDLPDIANIEYAYHHMAIDAGLEMSNCKLFKGRSGKYYFGTKRFDRSLNNRLHLHSASGLMHDNYRLSSMDYGHLMDCAFRLENHVDAYKKILKLAAFNVFSHNRDDHSKNFSFLMDLNGKWRFAPVYDLTFSYSAYGHHSTMIAGESKSPGKADLLKLAAHFGVKNANEIIGQIQNVISNWKNYAKDSGVSKVSMDKIQLSLSSIN